ncbi:hypothetical protein ES703_42375 [subsurface metagenome]
MSLCLLSTYTRHQIIKIYSKYRDMKYYISSKINLAGRDIRLFIFFWGGLFEGLAWIGLFPKGLPLTLSMGIVCLFHLVQFSKSFIELKKNLNLIE